jgi:hypothetical protein
MHDLADRVMSCPAADVLLGLEGQAAAIYKDIDRVRMQSELEEELNLKADQCMIIDLGADEESAREAVAVLGESLPQAQSGMVVV